MAEIQPQVREFFDSASGLAIPKNAGKAALVSGASLGLVAGAAYNKNAKQKWDNPDARVVHSGQVPDQAKRMGYLVYNHGGSLENATKMAVAWSHMEGRPFAVVVPPDYGRWEDNGAVTEQEAMSKDIELRGAEDVTIAAPSYGLHRVLHWARYIRELNRIDADCPVVDYSDYIDEGKKELIEKLSQHPNIYEQLANPLLSAAVASYIYKSPEGEGRVRGVANRVMAGVDQVNGRGTSPVGYLEDVMQFSATSEGYGDALIRDFRKHSPNVEVNVFHPLETYGDDIADGPRVVSRLRDGDVPVKEFLIPGGGHVISERSAGEYMQQASLGGLEQSPQYAAELALANFHE